MKTMVVLFYLVLAFGPLIWVLFSRTKKANEKKSNAVAFGSIAWTAITLLIGVVLWLLSENYINYLFFAEEQGHAQRFWVTFQVFWSWFALVGGVTLVWVFATNIRMIQKSVDEMPKTALAAYSIVVAIGIGVFAGSTGWDTTLLYLNHESGGIADPIFGKALSFYLFEYPLYDILHSILGFVIIVSLLPIVLGIGRLAKDIDKKKSSDDFEFHDTPQKNDSEESEKPEGPALVTLVVRSAYFNAGLFLLWLAIAEYLDRFGMNLADHGVVQGVNYVDDVWNAPANFGFMILWIVTAIWLFVSMYVEKIRPVTLISIFNMVETSGKWAATKRAMVHPIGYSLVLLLIAKAVVPGVLHAILVSPNEVAANGPYIQSTMDFTRRAWNLTDATLEHKLFPIKNDITPEDAEAMAASLDAARIWDYRVWSKWVVRSQSINKIYDFPDIDLDRYRDENGTVVPVLVAGREIDISNLTERAQTWQNQRLHFTHGNGVVVSPVNKFVGQGAPQFLSHSVPSKATEPFLEVTEPRLYFGKNDIGVSYVNTKVAEFDAPDPSQENQNLSNHYACKGGIKLNSLVRKWSAAWSNDDLRLLFSKAITSESKMLIKRKVTDRVTSLVPFLKADSDWYTVVHKGRLVAMQDLYTTSEYYPYAEEYGVEGTTYKSRYVRNSVKAVMDLCDGIVDLYIFDESDSIIKAYAKSFPGMFKPRSAMPQGLVEHVRYPEYLFDAQHQIYSVYHVDNMKAFFQGNNIWGDPVEVYRGRQVKMESRYIVNQLPGMTAPEFFIQRPFVFALEGRRRMTGYLAGLSDGENYGKLVAYQFSANSHVDGPLQAEAKISENEKFQESFKLWDNASSSVFRGNLIIIPTVTGHLLGFEPVYRKAKASPIPELARVISVQFRDDQNDKFRIVWEETYEKSRELLMGFAKRNRLVEPDADTEKMSDAELLRRVQAHLVQHQTLSGAGRFSEAGVELEKAMQTLTTRVGKVAQIVE